MTAHLGLDLTWHELYDPESIAQADDDLMKTVHNIPPFLFLEFLRSSGRVITFEKILANNIDKDEDYQRVKSEGLTSTSNPMDMGLVLAGQPIKIIVDLMQAVDMAA